MCFRIYFQKEDQLLFNLNMQRIMKFKSIEVKASDYRGFEIFKRCLNNRSSFFILVRVSLNKSRAFSKNISLKILKNKETNISLNISNSYRENIPACNFYKI